MKFPGKRNTGCFETKSLWKYDIYWLLKCSWGWKIRYFLMQKVDGKVIFTGYWKVLVLSFSVMENAVFFEAKSSWKDDIYWLLKSSCFGLPKSYCFELFGDGKHGLFFSEKIDLKVICTWSLWAFHDIPGPEKYGFSCSVVAKLVLPEISSFKGITQPNLK